MSTLSRPRGDVIRYALSIAAVSSARTILLHLSMSVEQAGWTDRAANECVNLRDFCAMGGPAPAEVLRMVAGNSKPDFAAALNQALALVAETSERRAAA
ncbi:MAG: hypothetical protein RLZZ501_1571 [Pseudomonadota bacterium]|jgi:hypothetical protein